MLCIIYCIYIYIISTAIYHIYMYTHYKYRLQAYCPLHIGAPAQCMKRTRRRSVCVGYSVSESRFRILRRRARGPARHCLPLHIIYNITPPPPSTPPISGRAFAAAERSAAHGYAALICDARLCHHSLHIYAALEERACIPSTLACRAASLASHHDYSTNSISCVCVLSSVYYPVLLLLLCVCV
jgi:hypothetical protein